MNVDTVAPDPQYLLDWKNGQTPQISETASENSNTRANVAITQATVYSVLVPVTITVGSDCSLITSIDASGKVHKRNECNTANTYALEYYVSNGLPSEWHSYWKADSLEAGAVAYRSYGVWFVEHPLSANYNICNTTYCQVFAPNKATQSTTAAAQNTAGVVLSRDGVKAFRAEYAAETNGFANPKSGCADGFSGNPSQGWPCMPDALSLGAAAPKKEADHGRGMSQRGSQRWASGKNVQGVKVTQTTPWECILDHYYNDNGNSTGLGTGERTAFIHNAGGDGVLGVDGVILSNINGSNPRQLAVGGSPTFSAGQKYILFQNPDGTFSKMTSDGANVTPFDVQVQNGGVSPWLSWSPAGSTQEDGEGDILFSNTQDIYTVSASGGSATNITKNGDSFGADQEPAWSPDGKKIATAELRFGDFTNYGWYIAVMNADGYNQVAMTPTDGSINCFFPSWSPDGQSLTANCGPPDAIDTVLYVVNNTGMRQVATAPPGSTFFRFRLYSRW